MTSTHGDTGAPRPVPPPKRGDVRQLRPASSSSRRPRVRWAAALTVTAGMALAACASNAASPTTTSKSAAKTSPSNATPVAAKVTEVSLWESHNSGPVGSAVSALVAKFNASHPSIHVTVTVTKASTKLLAALAAGDPPVLAEISHYDGQYVKAHALVSWNGFMKKSSVINKSQIFPSVWKNGEVQGQHYRLQADTKVSIVDYNKSLFQRAGISAPPKTWALLMTLLFFMKPFHEIRACAFTYWPS